MHPVFQILTAMSQGYALSWLTSWGQEVAAGGTTNKIWTFLIEYILILIAFSPLYFIFPDASLILNMVYYSSIACAAGLSYLASICHMNQVKRQTGDTTKIQSLPFNLHNKPGFTRVVLFASKHLTYVLYALYAAVLLLGVYFGHYLFVAASVSMIVVDQLYQQRWFPSFLETPYFLLSSCLQVAVMFGFSNRFWIGLNLISVGFFIWDYVQTHLRGVQSASSQFRVASKAHEFSFEKQALQKPTQKSALLALLEPFKRASVGVTFNHFREASVVTDRVLGKAKAIDFSEYIKAFNALDFKSPDLRAFIFDEMAIHDKFHECSYDEHRLRLKLPPDTQAVDVQIAFLKQELAATVQRLNNPSYRALNHQQINTLLGQSRLVLDFLLKTKDADVRKCILLSLAIRTGTHCYRMYIETFAELFHAHVYKDAPLTLKDKAVLAAQSLREDKFRAYYYEVLPKIRKFQAYTFNLGYFLSSDKDDYHTYEDFALNYGGYFYLQNQSLSQRVRSLFDVFIDYVNTYGFLKVIGSNCLFSDHYHEACLIDAVVDGKGKLHLIFKAWCESLYPEAYHDVMLDEDFYPVKKDDVNLRALAKMMLLDLGLVELTQPYEKLQQQDNKTTSTYDWMLSLLGYGAKVSTPLKSVQKPRETVQALFQSKPEPEVKSSLNTYQSYV